MVRLINKLKNKKGFTLIELIVVLAVLGVIMAIAVPRFTGVQEQAKIDADARTLDMIAKACEIYYIQEGETPTLAKLQSRGDVESGLKFQVDNDTISDDNIVITTDSTTKKVTVTRKGA